MNLKQLVRAQVLAEGGYQQRDALRAAVFIDETIDNMSNTEFLDRISEALATLYVPKAQL